MADNSISETILDVEKTLRELHKKMERYRSNAEQLEQAEKGLDESITNLRQLGEGLGQLINATHTAVDTFKETGPEQIVGKVIEGNKQFEQRIQKATNEIQDEIAAVKTVAERLDNRPVIKAVEEVEDRLEQQTMALSDEIEKARRATKDKMKKLQGYLKWVLALQAILVVGIVFLVLVNL